MHHIFFCFLIRSAKNKPHKLLDRHSIEFTEQGQVTGKLVVCPFVDDGREVQVAPPFGKTQEQAGKGGRRRRRRCGRGVHEQRGEHPAEEEVAILSNAAACVLAVDQAGGRPHAAPDDGGGGGGGDHRPSRRRGCETRPGSEKKATLLRRWRWSKQRREFLLLRHVQPRVDPEQRVGWSTGRRIVAVEVK